MKLTRYERARIIGARALQISMGAPPMIKVSKNSVDPITIAIKELDVGIIPMTVKRSMPEKKLMGEVQ
ncbi:MAG TPA: DNA-directed RNA polymerase subunit K [Euryarchaeota archaeon]|nr:DNA-directed RNA polymerase subunit K [archaeon BMS3Bbin15]HDL14613.1 DNA-directed RNA polymerase subunit K [Euryarchaeota archaeon]